MKGSFTTKLVLSIVLATIVVGIATVGLVVTIKNSKQQNEITEPKNNNSILNIEIESNTENLVNTKDNEINLNSDFGKPIEIGQENSIENTTIETSTPIKNDTPREPESTTIEQERKVAEKTILKWSNIDLDVKGSNYQDKEINYSNLRYTVEYYYDGIKDYSKTEVIPANKLGDRITTYTDNRIDGYELEKATVDEEHPLIISYDEELNKIKVYYSKPNITIKKEAIRKANVGDEITYKITLKNEGKVNGKTSVIDVLPDGLEFISVDKGGIYSKQEGRITWENIKVANNSATELTVVAKVKRNMIGKEIANTAKLTDDKTSTVITEISELMADVKEIKQGETGKDSVNVVLIIDLSYSMEEKKVSNGTTKRIEAAKTAAQRFINTLYKNGENSNATVTVITFNTKNPITRNVNEKTETAPYSGTSQLGETVNSKNYAELVTKIGNITLPATNPGNIEGWNSNGMGTNIGAALDFAKTKIESLKTTKPYLNNRNAVIFLSDGEPTSSYANNSSEYIKKVANEIKQELADFYSIGFGSDAANSSKAAYKLLYAMSSNEKVYTSDSVQELVENFTNILEEIKDKKVKSQDGIIRITTGNTLIVDNNNPIIIKYKGTEIIKCTSEADLSKYNLSYNLNKKELSWNINEWNSVEGHTKVITDETILSYYIVK